MAVPSMKIGSQPRWESSCSITGLISLDAKNLAIFEREVREFLSKPQRYSEILLLSGFFLNPAKVLCARSSLSKSTSQRFPSPRAIE